MGTEPTSLRLDTDAKKAAYAIFAKVGLKPAQAVNLFLRQVALNNGLPFSINIPNPTTRAAMKELEDGSGTRFDKSDDFYDDLEI
ncbi:MAG: type II toxin-antitoxin system RelB/DinJ family antitoxin [Candidatus Hydrogenedentes bacterium]|nr:type II toxin-antitoxin system RelB/DinJ family antitoxin [Candidatus Hydrogenedentota bacterium]